MAQGEALYLEATLAALQDSEKRLGDLLHRQVRAIEATGRPDPELAGKIAEEKSICESLRGQLDHEALIRPAIEGEKRARDSRTGAQKSAKNRREHHADITRDARRMLDRGTDRYEVLNVLADRYDLKRETIRKILKKTDL